MTNDLTRMSLASILSQYSDAWLEHYSDARKWNEIATMPDHSTPPDRRRAIIQDPREFWGQLNMVQVSSPKTQRDFELRLGASSPYSDTITVYGRFTTDPTLISPMLGILDFRVNEQGQLPKSDYRFVREFHMEQPPEWIELQQIAQWIVVMLEQGWDFPTGYSCRVVPR